MEEIIFDGYPENIQKALKLFMQYSSDNKYGKHIVKTYNMGYIGIASELHSETIMNNNPISRIFKKYYPNLGSFTIGVNNVSKRIFPCYVENENYHSFTEEMIANKEMWNEMAKVGLIESTYEYEEDWPLDLQYMEYRQKRMIEERKDEQDDYKINKLANSLMSIIGMKNKNQKKWWKIWKK